MAFDFGTPFERSLVDKALKHWKDTPKILSRECLPPGVDNEQFQSILAQFEQLLGKDNVVSGEQHRRQYGDPFAFDSEADQEYTSSAAVQPTTTEQVQGVLKVCNAYSIPVWTVSQGKNLGYGGSAPRVAGSLIMDLSKMSKIIEVNDEYCYCLIEPGVTFVDLYEHVKKNNLKVWVSSPALGWGSICGNALERGWGYLPKHSAHAEAICGMEVVLADGNVIRTGMGAIEGGRCWQLFHGAYGPSYDSIFNQSNFGVVTKIGMWMYPQPEGYMSVGVEVQNEKDLALLVNTLTPLLLRDVIQNHPVIGNIPRQLSMLGPRSKFYDGEGAIPDERLLEIQKELNCGFWHARFALYGSDVIMEYNFSRIKAEFAKISGATVHGTKYLAEEGMLLNSAVINPVDGGGQIGMPGMVALASLEYRGTDGAHIGFSPIMPPSGEDALKFYYSAKQTSAKFGFDFYAGLHLYPRHLCHINMLLFDRKDPVQKKNVKLLFHALVKEARNQGYSEYRAHLDFMDLVAEQYDYRDGAMMQLNNRIKDCLDPKGILSPGKQGIWPGRAQKAAN